MFFHLMEQNRYNQLSHFLKGYKRTDGLYFSLHFSDLNLKKMNLDLIDFYDGSPLMDPVFSPNCAKNNKNICIFNIKTLNGFLNENEFDESSKIICPVCKNVSPVMSFYYEESIIKILKKIKSFTQSNEERKYQISIKPNLKWKTKNFIYLKGSIKDDNEEIFEKKNRSDFFDLDDYDHEEEEKFGFTDKNENNSPFEKNTNIGNNSLTTQKFILILSNSNNMFSYEIWQDQCMVFNHKIYCNLKMMVPFIFYKKFVYLTTKTNSIYVMNDGGSIFKNKQYYELFDCKKYEDIVMTKIWSFDFRFHSPKIHYFNDSLYIIGGCREKNSEKLKECDFEINLKECYKIITQTEKQTECLILKKMNNVRVDYFSCLMEDLGCVYIFGGKILRNSDFVRENSCFEKYDINHDIWEEINLIKDQKFNEEYFDYFEIGEEKKLIFFGKNCKYSVEPQKLIVSEILEWKPNKILINFAEQLKNSAESFEEEMRKDYLEGSVLLAFMNYHKIESISE